VWKLDWLGRNLHHLVNTVHDLTARGVGLKVLTGQGAAIDTTTAPGNLVFGIFAALAEFERELISERTIAGLASARARKGGRPFKMTPAKLRPGRGIHEHRQQPRLRGIRGQRPQGQTLRRRCHRDLGELAVQPREILLR